MISTYFLPEICRKHEKKLFFAPMCTLRGNTRKGRLTGELIRVGEATTGGQRRNTRHVKQNKG